MKNFIVLHFTWIHLIIIQLITTNSTITPPITNFGFYPHYYFIQHPIMS